MSAKQVFTDQTSDGSSLEFNANNVNPNQKQDPFLAIKGEFDGATVTLEYQDPNGDWDATDPVEDIWTVGKLQPLYLNSFGSYRLTITNAGGSTSINAWLLGIN